MEEESDRVNYNTIERQVQQRYNDEKESINWKRFGVWTYVFVTLLAIIVFTNFLYKESLFELSNKFTKSIQGNSNFFNSLMINLDEFGESEKLLIILLI